MDHVKPVGHVLCPTYGICLVTTQIRKRRDPADFTDPVFSPSQLPETAGCNGPICEIH